MHQRLQGALGLLRLVLAASIIFPLALFSYASWQTYEALVAKADMQIRGTLDLAETHARNLFQTSDLAIQAADDLVAGLSDQEIADRSEEFRARFLLIQHNLAAIQAIWLLGKDGRSLSNSRISPNPRQVDFSKRAYFQAQQTQDAGLFIGRVLKPITPGSPSFALSRRRFSPDGSFNGVIVIALAPDYFRDLYAKIGHEFPRNVSLILANGAVLASDPQTNSAPSWCDKACLRQAAGLVGSLGLTGDSNGERFGLRQVAGYPAFIATSVADGAILTDAGWDMARQLISASRRRLLWLR